MDKIFLYLMAFVAEDLELCQLCISLPLCSEFWDRRSTARSDLGYPCMIDA